MLPPGVEVVVFNGGGEPSAQYRDFSATAELIEEGRAEVAEVLDRYAGTSQDLTPHRAGPRPPPTAPPPVPSPIEPTGQPTAGPDRRRPSPHPGAHHPSRPRTTGALPGERDDRYLLPNAEEAAAERFAAFTELFDPSTFAHMDRLGLAPGWRCWEVGAGGDSVVRWLAGRVGPQGHVLATDIDVTRARPRRMGPARRLRCAPRCRPRPSPRRPVRPGPRPTGAGAHSRAGEGHGGDGGFPAPRGLAVRRGRRPGAAAAELAGGARARAGAGQPIAVRVPGVDGLAGCRPGLWPDPAPPAPGGGPGRRAGRCGVPGGPPGVRPARRRPPSTSSRASCWSTASPRRRRSSSTWPTWPPGGSI